MFGRLRRALVWPPGAIPDGAKGHQLNTRFWLAVFDIGLVVWGISGARTHIPALDEAYAPGLVDVFSYLLTVLGAVAFFGVIFPQLERVEMAAKLGLIGILSVYPSVLLWSALIDGREDRLFAGIGLALVVIIPFQRIGDLALRIWRHRAGAPPTGPIEQVGGHG